MDCLQGGAEVRLLEVRTPRGDHLAGLRSERERVQEPNARKEKENAVINLH